MIKAFQAGYLKFDEESSKRKGQYLVIEMTVKSMTSIHLIIISQDGLVHAGSVATVTEIAGYHRYTGVNDKNLGAGELKSLDTKESIGMIEGLSKQIGFSYQITATAFGEGLLKVCGHP